MVQWRARSWSRARRTGSGERVALLDLDAEKLGCTTDELRGTGSTVVGIQTDVRDAGSVAQAVGRVVQQFGGLDVAGSNAGVYPNTPVIEMDEDDWDPVLDTNLKGAFLVTRAAARHMVQRGHGGKLCPIASGAHQSARVGAAHYCASKAGLVLYAKAVALELAEHGINVNVVSPGFVDVGERPGASATYRDAISRTIRWGRVGTPEDIARTVLLVCSPEAEFVTGAVLSVDGGSSAGRFHLPRSD